MNALLLLQLTVSFIAGGCFITLLSLIAERANEKVAGIIMMFPSTIVLGFFFLGLTTSAEAVATVVPATLVPLGIIIFASVIYIYSSLFFARYIKSKKKQIPASFICSSLIWFVIASPFAVYKFSNLYMAAAGFFILILLAHIILNRPKFEEEIPRPKHSKAHILLRAVFTGSIIAMVVYFGESAQSLLGRDLYDVSRSDIRGPYDLSLLL